MERIELLEFNTSSRTADVAYHKNLELERANHLIQSGLFREANENLRLLLAQDSENPEILKKIGQCFKLLREPEKSLPIYRILARVEPSLENRCLLAETYEILGELDRAKSMYQKLLSDPKVDEATLFCSYKNLGNIQLKIGDYEAAEESYNKAYIQNSKSDVLFVNYGTLEVQKCNYARALDRYRKALQINGENDKAWVGLGLMHRECGDHELAWANVELALDINSSNETALELLIDWGFRDQRTPRMLARLKSLILRRPMNSFLRKTLQNVQARLAKDNLSTFSEEKRMDRPGFATPSL